jgi:hypothetical protein
MKVIGIANQFHVKYICEVSHTEIEQFLNTYYGGTKRLEVGAEVDLGKGYDFAKDAKDAMDKTSDLIKSNKKVIEAILNGIQVVGKPQD